MTDPEDRLLADGDARFAARAADILRAFSREPLRSAPADSTGRPRAAP